MQGGNFSENTLYLWLTGFT